MGSLFKLNKETKEFVYSTTGMDVEKIIYSDISEVDSAIEKHTNKKLKPALTLGGLFSRGSVYLMMNRYFTRKYVDHQLSKIKP